jgi:RHS repeat-associated protein
MAKLYRVDTYAGTPSWVDVTPGSDHAPRHAYGIAVDCANQNNVTVLAENATDDLRRYVSTDQGASWTDEGLTTYTGLSQTDAYLLLVGVGTMGFSENGGNTVENKTANLASIFGSTSRIRGLLDNFWALEALDASIHESCKTCSVNHACSELYSSHQVGLRTGEKREDVTDLTITTPAGPLAFARTYRQSKQSDLHYQFMGLGWTHNHHVRLVENTGVTPNTIVVRMSGGGEVHFTKTATNHYAADAGSTSFIDVDPGSASARYTLTAADQSRYVFDSNQRLVSRSWPNGEAWTYNYDGSDRLIEVVDDAYDLGGGVKRKLSFSYYTSGPHTGQLQRVTDHTGRYVEFAYVLDSGGTKSLLSAVTDVRGNGWTYNYYGQGAGETDPNQMNWLTQAGSPPVDTTGDGTPDGPLTLKALTYLLSGTTLTGLTEKLGHTTSPLLQTSFAFQPGGQNLTTEETAGQVTTHRFARGVYVGPKDPAGHYGFQLVNRQYRPKFQIDANGHETRLKWSADGKQLNQVADALNHTTQFDYNANGTLNYSLDAQGRKTEYTYGDANNPRLPTRIRVLDTDGTTVLRWQEFVYDLKGRTTEERLHDPANGTVVLQKVTRAYYASGNGNGLLQTVTQLDLENPANNTWTTYTYEATGRVIKTQKSSLLGSCQFSYTVYDAAGNVLATVCSRQNTTPPTTVAEALAMYDANDPVKKHTRVTTFEYDSLGRRVKTTANDGAAFARTALTFYDALDRVWRTIDHYQPQGTSAPGDWVWANNQWEYSPGNPVSHGSDNTANLIADTDYNDLGLVRLRRDALGSVTLYGYDDAGRLVKTVQNAATPGYNNDFSGASPDPDLSEYSENTSSPDKDLITVQVYDAAGNLIKTIDPLGSVTVMIYDALNRPFKTIRNPHDPDYDFAADPDLSGYTLSGDPDTDLVEETVYDTMGRVTETRRLLDNRGGTEQWNVTRLVYDQLDRQIRTIANFVDQGEDPSLWVWDDAVGQKRWEKSDETPIDHADNDQNLITETVYDEAGRVQETIDVNRAHTRSVYDGLGRQVLAIANYQANGYALPEQWVWESNVWKDSPGGTVISHGAGNDENIITQTVYDGDGRVQETRDVEGKLTRRVYDAQGRPTLTVGNYDPTGTTQTADYWLWDATDGRWEDGAGHAVLRTTTYDGQPTYDLNLIAETVYDDQGRVRETRDARGNLTRFVYDMVGRRVRTIANYVPQGGTDPANWVWDATDGRWERGAGDNTAIDHGTNQDQNRIADTTYDLVGRVVTTRDTAGIVTRQVYDALGRRVRTINNYVAQGATDPADWVWANERWENGSGSAIAHGAAFDQNLISDTVYNKAGQVTATRDARGTLTAFVYDGAGRRLQVKQANGSPLETGSYTCYDKAGRVRRTIATYVPAYDASQQLISPDEWVGSTWRFAPAYNDGANNDRNRIVAYKYDAAGRRVKVVDPVGSETATAYFLDGQVDTMTDPEGMVSLYRYDQLHRRKLVVQGYIANGQDPSLWVWDANETPPRWEKNDGTAIVHGANNDQNVIVQVAYDLLGRRTSQCDPNGILTVYRYAQLGRRITQVTNYVPQGNPESDPANWQWVTDHWEYAPSSPVSHGTDNDENLFITQTAYQDTQDGNSFTGETQVIVTKPDGTQTTRDFDRLGRPRQVDYGNPADTYQVTFAYNAAGNPSQMVENDGTADKRITGYEYDGARRLKKAQFNTDGIGGWDEEVAYTYDLGGQRTTLTLPGSLAVTYTYDCKGQLVSLTDWDGHQTRFAHDNANRLVAAERANDLISRYRYDAAGRLRLLRHTRGARTLAHFAYEVDKRGNRIQALELLAHPATMGDTVYAYNDKSILYQGTWTDDAVNSMKVAAGFSASLKLMFVGSAATLTVGVGPDHGMFDVYVSGSLWQSFDGYAAASGTRDIALNLASEGPHLLEIRNRAEHHLASGGYTLNFKQLVVPDVAYDLRTLEYTYDALARLREARYNPGVNVDAADTDLLRRDQYTYDLAGNRTQQIVTVGGSPVTTNFAYNGANQIINAGFTYDANGNLVSDGTNTYTWDRANRLTGMGGLTYAYDGAGNRISQSNGVDVTRYLLDLQPGLAKVLAATTGANTERYVFNPYSALHAQENSAGVWTWPVADGLGSMRGIVSDVGNVDSFQSYAPYGDPLETGVFGSPFMFTGELMDSNDLVYLRNRYYVPELGVFPSLDPLENLNRYQYVGANPANIADPSGLCPLLHEDSLLQRTDAQQCDKLKKELQSWGVNVEWDEGTLAPSICVPDSVRQVMEQAQSVRQRWTTNEMRAVYDAFRIFAEARQQLLFGIVFPWPLPPEKRITVEKHHQIDEDPDALGIHYYPDRRISMSASKWGSAAGNLFPHVTDARQYRTWMVLHEFDHIFAKDRATTITTEHELQYLPPGPQPEVYVEAESAPGTLAQEIVDAGFNSYPLSAYAPSAKEILIEALTGTLWNFGYHVISGFDETAGGRTGYWTTTIKSLGIEGNNYVNVREIESTSAVGLGYQPGLPPNRATLPTLPQGTSLEKWVVSRIIWGFVSQPPTCQEVTPSGIRRCPY